MLINKPGTSVRYLSSSAFNCYITIINPNAGNETDGTPLGAVTVATNIHANVSPWRSKEIDKAQTRVGSSTYKIVVRYPKTYSVDTGMQIQFTRSGNTILMNIDSIYDPDGQAVELHIYTFAIDATYTGSTQ